MDGNELAVVPVLPMWVESLPHEIEELADHGFQTVVRVPFNEDLRPDPELDEEKWLAVVRDAIKGVSDEMLLLLGAFDEVVLDDRLGGQKTSIQLDWDASHELPDTTAREQDVLHGPRAPLVAPSAAGVRDRRDRRVRARRTGAASRPRSSASPYGLSS